ncbi:MAG TPA: GAF domain-containing protein [Mucilaginibacter sp.]|nr:GAF domain-containing protein [Mucilaginibacter sp.]
MIYNDIRLLAVERFKTLDIDADSEFQEFVQMASEICSSPIALITLIDEDTQWLKVRKGTDVPQMPRKTSFCTHTMEQDGVFVVPDAQKDDRFSNNPIVAGAPNVRFYAGAPLITNDGLRIGTICVIDLEPHELNANQQMMLKMLGKQAIGLMDFRISVELLEKNKIEVEYQREIIKKAEITQRSFFESAPNFQILLGKKCELIDFNKVAYNFVKKVHGKKMARGNSFAPFLAADFEAQFKMGFENALQGKNAFEEGSTDYGVHGLIYWEASFETAKDPENNIIGVSYIIRDVTDRKIKELKIIAQNQSLLKIAHQQAHEFRAPLTTITGMMDLIKAEDYNAPKEYYALLESAVQNLDGMIREIVTDIDNIVPSNGIEVHAV